jgi:hypothetical protein
MTKIRCQTTPQQRSNLARKAAQARWSHVNGRGDANGSPNPNGSSITNGSPSLPANREPRTAKRSKLIAHSSWLDSRFCLRLEQDSSGEWFLLTPAGLRLPASPAEISLWLDLQSLRAR